MDVDPQYREWAPPPRLRAAVACFWARTVGGDTRVGVLPDACSDLIWQADRGAFVAGPDTGPVTTTHPPGAVLLGVRFLPGAGGPALRTPLNELRNMRVDLIDLLPKLARSLGDSLSPDEALGRLVDVTAELVDAGPPDPIVQDVGRRLTDPRVSVAALADELALSERHLRRRCQQAVGYGPKTLHRVLRFRRFLASADSCPHLDLAGLAFSAGYADQAHLTRECSALAGMSPGQLLRSA
jgi:AraC-like DNA-binding protein